MRKLGNMCAWRKMAISLLLAGASLAGAFAPRGQGESWSSYSKRLKGLAETYKKWGITFKFEPKAVLNSQAGPLPSYFKVVSQLESPDTLKVNVESGLGKNDEAALALAGEFKIGPDGKKVSGNGVLYLKGTGVGGTFKYDNATGLQLETGLEETFYSIGINIGNAEKGPVGLGLKLGPAKVEIDLAKWAKRCKEVGPTLAKAGASKVGGVMVRADVPDLAAAITNAPEPDKERLATYTAVSLKALAKGVATSRITEITGVAVDKTNRDLLLLGRRVPGQEPISPEFVVALCKAVAKDGTTPYVSIDPDPSDPTLPHRGRIGGLPSGAQDCLLSKTLLEIDYALKSIVIGDVRVPGIRSVAQIFEESDNLPANSGGRFWFVPRELTPGDVSVERGSGLSIYWFQARPIVRTEPMGFGSVSAMPAELRSALESLATSITQRLSAVEQAYPKVRVGALRQIFGLATAFSILRQDPQKDVVNEVVDEISRISLPRYDFSMTFQPLRKAIYKDGGLRKIDLAGGIYSGASLFGGVGDASTVDRTKANAVRSSAKSGKAGIGRSLRDFVNGEKVSVSEALAGDYSLIAYHLRKKDYESASAAVDELLSRNPGAVEALLLKMEATLHLGRWTTMRSDAQRYIKARPKLGRGYYWLSVAEGMIGRLHEAREAADKAIELAPTDAEGYLVRSNMRRRFDPQGAIDDGTKGILLSPQSAFAYSMRAQAYADVRRLDEAIADMEMAASLNPMVLDYWLFLGLYRLQSDRNAGAEEALTRALALEPRDPFTYFGRAEARYKQSKWAQALEDYEMAVRIDPTLMKQAGSKIEDCKKKIGGGGSMVPSESQVLRAWSAKKAEMHRNCRATLLG